MIFVDTSYWIALMRVQDDRHALAAELFARYRGEPLATSNHVRGELWTFLRRFTGHAPAVAAVDRIDAASRVELLIVSREDELEAWSWLRRRDERRYSFVDATSFALMRRLAIRDVLAFDEDFAAAGFVELRA